MQISFAAASVVLALVSAVLLAACEAGPEARAAETGQGTAATAAATSPASQPEKTAGVVDSVIPIPEALARFRRDLPDPGRLVGGAGTPDALVDSVVHALQRADTAAFERLGVSRSEWAWLFYPSDVLSRPPYELPPALAWFQLQEANRTGVLRMLRELGGRLLDHRRFACDPEPRVEGANRIWIHCRVELAVRGAEPHQIRLFSAILERDGRFAVLSYDNDF